jgi:hypothetical protein
VIPGTSCGRGSQDRSGKCSWLSANQLTATIFNSKYALNPDGHKYCSDAHWLFLILRKVRSMEMHKVGSHFDERLFPIHSITLATPIRSSVFLTTAVTRKRQEMLRRSLTTSPVTMRASEAVDTGRAIWSFLPTGRTCMSRSAPVRTLMMTKAKSVEPTFWRLIRTARMNVCSRPESAIPSAWRRIPRQASCGLPSTNATYWATIWCLTISHTLKGTASTAGHGITSVRIRIRDTRGNIRN